MAKDAKYTIFKTNWGYFGLATNEKGLFRTVLPCPSKRKRRRACPTLKITKKYLTEGLNNPKFDKNLLKPLQDKIIAYFEGKPTRFDTPIALDNLPPFIRKVLAACRKIPSGKTVSYSQLARKIGKPRASRAVGNALAKNPIPLIIPCHRVIRCDGSPGNFSAFGGTDTKKNLIDLERKH
ncbi:MAG: methylated-DNA--[protein]-cysteine S-methyltransferase [Planctomycetota bacterium]